MKNFYEATVTKPSLTLAISLTLEPIGKLPCLVKINGATLFDNTLSDKIVINHKIGLEDCVDISIQIYRHHPDAVVASLTIDDIEILPRYLDLANPPTNYLDRSGIWTFKIPSFYPWHHEITGQGWVA
jgi:hypothetical protein